MSNDECAANLRSEADDKHPRGSVKHAPAPGWCRIGAGQVRGIDDERDARDRGRGVGARTPEKTTEQAEECLHAPILPAGLRFRQSQRAENGGG